MNITLKQTNILKGIAIICVILGHLHLIKGAGNWGVGLFLILSGYGLTMSYSKNGLNKFFKKKLTKILIPYSIITILWITIDYFRSVRYSFIDVLTSIIGINFKAVVDSTMWYISYIVIWYIIFYLIFKYIKSNNFKIIGMLFFSIVFYFSANILFDASVGAPIYVFQFPLGVILALYNEKIKNINKKSMVITLVISIVLFILCLNIDKLIIGLIRINTFALISIIIVSLFEESYFKAIGFIGNISYEIYLFEAVFLWKYTFVFDLIENMLISIIIYCAFLILIALIYKIIIEKFINKVTHN